MDNNNNTEVIYRYTGAYLALSCTSFFFCQITAASTVTKSVSTRSTASVLHSSHSNHSSSSNSATTSISPRNKALHRHDSEGSCLSELKESIEKDGDLAKTVVRIEVCGIIGFTFRQATMTLSDQTNQILPFFYRHHLIPPLKKFMTM